MKLSVMALGMALILASAVDAKSATESCATHGQNYRYYHNGHHYRYHHKGGYYNHRFRCHAGYCYH